MDDYEHDEDFLDDIQEKSEYEEWFEDDCRERARDMQDYCK